MTTEAPNSSTAETAGQEQDSQQTPNGETPQENETPGTNNSTPPEPEKLPEDHPLVKTLAANKSTIADLKRELTEARSHSSKATQLEDELAKRPTQETLDTLQTRYDRLEAFAQAVGLGRALDSRTFTKDLFESDKDIDTLVKAWNRANPTQTSSALSGGASEITQKQDQNSLLRIAAGK